MASLSKQLRVCLFLMTILLLFSAGGQANEVLEAVDAGNYLAAKELFYSKVVGNIFLEAEVFEGLQERIEGAVANFNARIWPYNRRASIFLPCSSSAWSLKRIGGMKRPEGWRRRRTPPLRTIT